MAISPPTSTDIQQSLERLQLTFEGNYQNLPILEDHYPIGAINSDLNKVYITFRGSVDSFWEILTCLDVRKSSLHEIGLLGHAHQGIFTAFSKVHKFVLDQLQEMDLTKQIIVEGYSRGAGIATLMAMYLKNQYPNRFITLLAYSPMKILDLAALHDKTMKTLSIYNFICREDPIPSWPPTALGFYRPGDDYIFSGFSFPKYKQRVQKLTYLHLASGVLGIVIKNILPARMWEAHMPETYQEGAPQLKVAKKSASLQD